MNEHSERRRALPAPLLEDDGDIVALGARTRRQPTIPLGEREAHDDRTRAPARARRHGPRIVAATLAAILVSAIAATVALNLGGPPPGTVDDSELVATLTDAATTTRAALATAAARSSRTAERRHRQAVARRRATVRRAARRAARWRAVRRWAAIRRARQHRPAAPVNTPARPATAPAPAAPAGRPAPVAQPVSSESAACIEFPPC